MHTNWFPVLILIASVILNVTAAAASTRESPSSHPLVEKGSSRSLRAFIGAAVAYFLALIMLVCNAGAWPTAAGAAILGLILTAAGSAYAKNEMRDG